MTHIHHQKDMETKNPYLVKRLSGTGGLVFYQVRDNQDEAGNNILTQERTNLAKGGVPGPGSGHSLHDR